MHTKGTTLAVLPLGLAKTLSDATFAQISSIVSVTADGKPQVRLDDDSPAVPARLALRVTRELIEAAIAERKPTVVLFENGDRSRPLIVGFIEALESHCPEPHIGVSEPADRRSEDRSFGADEVAVGGRPDKAEPMPVIEADVDGKRVRVTAQDEIVLQCGSASVTLRRNGRVIIRGTYVESRSDGTNRIKGGQVQIN
jgi:hypothetical protein